MSALLAPARARSYWELITGPNGAARDERIIPFVALPVPSRWKAFDEREGLVAIGKLPIRRVHRAVNRSLGSSQPVSILAFGCLDEARRSRGKWRPGGGSFGASFDPGALTGELAHCAVVRVRVVTRAQHARITTKLLSELKRGESLRGVTRFYRNFYRDHPEWVREIESFLGKIE